MFKGFRSIESRLIVWVLGATALIFLLTYYLLYRQFLAYTTANIQREAQLLTVTLGREIDARMQSVSAIARQHAAAIQVVNPDERQLRSMVRYFVSANDLHGGSIGYRENAFDERQRFAVSVHLRGDQIEEQDLTRTDNAYWQSDWYTLTVRQRGGIWTEPQFAAGQDNVLITTYATPLYTDGNQIAGVVTADISLETARQRLEATMADRKGHAVIFSGSGRVLVHPNQAFVGKETMASLIFQGINPEFQRISERIASGKEDVTAVETNDGDRVWVAFTPIPEAGWSLIYVIPEKEFLADVAHLVQMRLLWGLLGLVLLAAMIVYLARRVSRPLKRLALVANKVAEGDLEFELPSIDHPDEVGALTNSFAQMRDSLRHYIYDLKTATAERQKLESELDIAAQIQRGMLRGQSFVQEEPSHFEIAAALTPAKAVGGDFYDYAEMPENQLCVVVGDVSDKGVHAALFMARAITAVRSAVGANWEPDQILHAVNQELCRNNDACMFATLFCAVQDLRFGYLRYASAGHDPSVLINAIGEARFLEGDSGTAVGLDEDAEYESYKVRLRAGDVVLLYTDGVTEAASVKGELYGEERMLESVKDLINADARKVLNVVAVAVDEFAAGAPQADDLTLLTLRYGQASDQDLENGMQRLWKESSN